LYSFARGYKKNLHMSFIAETIKEIAQKEAALWDCNNVEREKVL